MSAERDAMSKTIEEWKAERDALRAEVERLKAQSISAEGVRLLAEELRLANEQIEVQAEELSGWRNAHTNFASRCVGCIFAARLLRAAQSLHRAWKRERELVERYQRDHDEWMWNADTCDCAICNDVRMTK